MAKQWIDCPNCQTINPCDTDEPLREQFCSHCLCALSLDNPAEIGLTNNQPRNGKYR